MKQINVIIIGAGPAGLVMGRELMKHGIEFKIIERNSDVGGIWNINAPNTPMYESAHFISSKTLSGFPDYPMPDSYPDYPSHKQIFAYIKSYADEFSLREHIHFDVSVLQANQNEKGKWTISTSSNTDYECDYLVCANGVTWEPNHVTWQGHFNGQVKHSRDYKSIDELKGKRVLVVGAGNSGVDIACDAAFAADKAILSMRRGYHFFPKYVMGQPADVFDRNSRGWPKFAKKIGLKLILKMSNGRLTNYGLPKPDHEILQTHPIMNTQILHYLGHGDCIAKPDIERLEGDRVYFKDGSFETVDLIISATGYKHAAPFLSKDVVNEKKGRPDLYLNMFPRNANRIAFLGFIEFASAAYENFAKMAEVIAIDIVHPNGLIEKLKQTHRPDLTKGGNYLKTERNTNYVNVETYLSTLKELKNKTSNQRLRSV